DAGGVAVHHQGDGAGRGYATDLGVAVAVLLAQLDHAVALAAGGVKEVVGAVARLDADGGDRQPFVLVPGGVVGGAAVVADDAQHGVAVGLVARERPDLGGDLGGGG